ncbi:MAG: glycosyltransferase [Taibaiella sp.]|nr:glycosyltransferase [Taibaiella sp.]
MGEGKERQKLHSLVQRLGLEGQVLLPGFAENVYPYFRHAELCVVSSRIEGFPNVLLQMMSQNGNVVTTRCAGGLEDIPDLLTAATHDIQGLAMAMKERLDHRLERDHYGAYLRTRDIAAFVSAINHKLSENV